VTFAANGRITTRLATASSSSSSSSSSSAVPLSRYEVSGRVLELHNDVDDPDTDDNSGMCRDDTLNDGVYLMKWSSKECVSFSLTKALDVCDERAAQFDGSRFQWRKSAVAPAGKSKEDFTMLHLVLAGGGGLFLGLVVSVLYCCCCRKKGGGGGGWGGSRQSPLLEDRNSIDIGTLNY
jgi:hypothetical protein